MSHSKTTDSGLQISLSKMNIHGKDVLVISISGDEQHKKLFGFEAEDKIVEAVAAAVESVSREFLCHLLPEDQVAIRCMRLLDKPIDPYEFTVRSGNCLRRENLLSLGELAMKTETEMLQIKNFGRTSLREVKNFLYERNLHFGMTAEELAEWRPPNEYRLL